MWQRRQAIRCHELKAEDNTEARETLLCIGWQLVEWVGFVEFKDYQGQAIKYPKKEGI